MGLGGARHLAFQVPGAGAGVCLSAAWLRRHQRRAAGQAEAAKPKSSSAPALNLEVKASKGWGQLPCWGVAIFGLLLAGH